jgi:hypothetical protein
MARLFVSFRYNAASEYYFVAVVLDAPASGVVVVLVPPPPVAAGFLSQPVVNAARPQRTSNVQIFFINKSFLITEAKSVAQRPSDTLSTRRRRREQIRHGSREAIRNRR